MHAAFAHVVAVDLDGADLGTDDLLLDAEIVLCCVVTDDDGDGLGHAAS
jgi:hypothetical protein